MHLAGTPFFFTGAEYTIDASLAWRRSADSRLDVTLSAATATDKWTLSWWQKLTDQATQVLFDASTGTVDNNIWGHHPNYVGRLALITANTHRYASGQVLATSTWQHLTLAYDAANAAPADRLRMWVDGVADAPVHDGRAGIGPGQCRFNMAVDHRIGGRIGGSGNALDGRLGEIHFVDGAALTAADFGKVIAGRWWPRKYTGSYGANGFFLKFLSVSALGADSSGNNRTFAPTNLSSADQSVTDTPTYGLDP